MATAMSAHAKRFVLLLWMLVAFFYFYLSYDYIRVTTTDRSFEDYLEYVVQIAGQDHRPAQEIRALLLVKADELGLPIKGQDISILGAGESLKVSVGYEMDIDVPLIQRQIFTKRFDHTVRYKQRY
jgi:hypothetical protein